MRDYRKLKVFHEADELALVLYRVTADFPKSEQFGLTSQMRRCAVSIASNIVEGCARKTQADYLRFVEIAYSSSRELEYQISLAFRLSYMNEPNYADIAERCDKTCRMLNSLMASFAAGDRRYRNRPRRRRGCCSASRQSPAASRSQLAAALIQTG